MALTQSDQSLQQQRFPREVIAQGSHPRNLSHEGRQVRSCLDRVERSLDRLTACYVETIAAVAVVLGEVRR
jgi:hypothetical protein